MKKPPLIFVKNLPDGSHESDEVYTWIMQALHCIQENQKVIYGLLPERQINPATGELKICERCKVNDFQGNVRCGCSCHFPAMTVSPNSTGTQYIAPLTVVIS